MKRLLLCLACIGVLLGNSGQEAFAGPQESLVKLMDSMKGLKQGGIPPVVLTQAEEDAMIDAVIKKAKSEGATLTRQQAAIIVGQLAGYAGMAQQMGDAFGGATSGNQRNKQQAMPEPHIFPSGMAGYMVDDLTKGFKTNEFAMVKAVEGKPTNVVGRIKNVKSGTYYKDPKDFMSGKGDFPVVALDGFDAYLVDDAIDPSVLIAGNSVALLCENFSKGMGFGVQAECRVVLSGPRDEKGIIQKDYVNDALYSLLYTEQ